MTLTFWPKIYRWLPFIVLHLCMKYLGWKLIKLLHYSKVWTDRLMDSQTDRVITKGLRHLRWRGPLSPYQTVQPLLNIAYKRPKWAFIEPKQGAPVSARAFNIQYSIMKAVAEDSVLLCFLPDRQTHRQTPDKVISTCMCHYASQATQKEE